MWKVWTQVAMIFSTIFLPKYNNSIDQHIAWTIVLPIWSPCFCLLPILCFQHSTQRDPLKMKSDHITIWSKSSNDFLFHLELKLNSLPWHTSPWLILCYPLYPCSHSVVTTRVLQTLFKSIRHASALESWTSCSLIRSLSLTNLDYSFSHHL